MSADSSDEVFHENTHRPSNRQTIIDMPASSNQTDQQPRSSIPNDEGQDSNPENQAQNDTNQSWNINIEINPETFNNAPNQEDMAALLNSLRQLLRQLDVTYFVPEVHFLNMLMLFFSIASFVILVKLAHLSGLILLAIVRFMYYYDAYRFNLKSESQFMSILLRIGIRNLLIYLVCDQQDFFNVLTFNIVETESFIYVLFIVSMANLMVLDGVLVLKVLFGYLPGIQLRRKREIYKLADYLLLVYFALLPILQWYAYIGNIWISLPYLALKLTILVYLCCQTLMVLKQFTHTVSLGTIPSKTEICGQICAICHSEPEKAVKTTCGHIFDEQCLREWLEIKNQCPLCRANVAEKHKNYPDVFLFPPYIF